MTLTHLLALLMILSVVLCILGGLSVLVVRGAQAGGIRRSETNIEAILAWNQLPVPSKSEILFRDKTLPICDTELLSSAGSRSGIARFTPVFNSLIADPVDGTAFEQGEPIVRCACGTNYHQHSWQWLGEKNQGKCVSCKRAGLISNYLC
ncbi:MAG TPA: hypothetical protein VHA33_07855 [Candidatus Angelobacter sp.]|jgi:hypothetical protein|nr:hypothetical protein [Candidatus Angelobacter sp.]